MTEQNEAAETAQGEENIKNSKEFYERETYEIVATIGKIDFNSFQKSFILLRGVEKYKVKKNENTFFNVFNRCDGIPPWRTESSKLVNTFEPIWIPPKIQNEIFTLISNIFCNQKEIKFIMECLGAEDHEYYELFALSHDF